MAEMTWTDHELDHIQEMVQAKYGVSILGQPERMRSFVRDFMAAAMAGAMQELADEQRSRSGAPEVTDDDLGNASPAVLKAMVRFWRRRAEIAAAHAPHDV